MALCSIDDVNLEILSWVIDFKLFISLLILNKKSYILITNTLIYEELNKLNNYDAKLNKKNMIDTCYKLGLINVLKKLKKNNENFVLATSIDYASKNGHIKILEWFKNSGLEFKYTVDAINIASANGHIGILDWFKNSNLEFKYTEYAIDIASANGHVGILDWFKNSGLEFKYTEHAINIASQYGYINILEW